MSEARYSTGRGPGRSEAKERLWWRHVERQRRSGLTIRGYCAQAGLSEPSFYGWRSELARRDSVADRTAPGETQAAGRPATAHTATAAPRFLPVTIAGPGTSHVEVSLPSGLLVRVPARETAALRAVLELLEPRSC